MPLPTYCTRCGEQLNAKNLIWLELDQKTGRYTDKEVPAEHSQGGFPFGVACAKAVLKAGGKLQLIRRAT